MLYCGFNYGKENNKRTSRKRVTNRGLEGNNMTFSSMAMLGQISRNSYIHGEECLQKFRDNPESARVYVESKGRIASWLLEHNVIGDTDKYHAAKTALREIGGQ